MNFNLKTFWRILGVSLVILLPIAIIMLLLFPFISGKESEFKQYQIKGEITGESFSHLINIMRQDAEFQFYFRILNLEQVQRVERELFQTLTTASDKQSVLNLIKIKEPRVKSLGAVFLNLDYPDPYFKAPQHFPELNQALRAFLDEEFQLTILGVYFKANYDMNFTFEWDHRTKQAAIKLQEILVKLKK